MRKIRYAVAMSVDGYIAGPNGEADELASTRKSTSLRSGRNSTLC